jgi:hypothetical protein
MLTLVVLSDRSGNVRAREFTSIAAANVLSPSDGTMNRSELDTMSLLEVSSSSGNIVVHLTDTFFYRDHSY